MSASGRPEPLGVTPAADGVNVAVFSAHAEAIEFCLFDAAGDTELARLWLPGRTGDVFHGHFAGVAPGARYGLRAHGPWRPADGHLFNPAKLLLDPYATAIDRHPALHPTLFDPPSGDRRDPADSAAFMPKGIVPAAASGGPWPARSPFDWDRAVLYELHVRGFTMRHPAIPAAQRGTFAGLGHPAAIDHLRRLGVTAVELMPCAAWLDERHLPPLGLSNYWGYNPVALLAPDPRLAPGGWPEVRAAVAALQQAGIAVLLDVVLNHTGEGDHLGPTVSLRGLDNATYYRLLPNDPSRLVNDAGCGNTLALDRAPVLRLAMDALRIWATQAGIDGFRFDLATTLGRRPDGFDPAAPLLVAIGQDPVLRDLALIAEPWDIGPGGYQLGAFPPAWGEWNDRYRDAVRRFWRGDGFMLGELATRFAGSADLFRGARPISRGVNFITAHDGFTLADLVAYANKHNEANGEANRDGTDDNHSWNNGAEGPTDDQAVRAARAADARALLATLLCSRGTPMLAMGDEVGRTQRGSNNAYAQDNALSWFDWATADAGLGAFAARLVRARLDSPALRAPVPLTGRAVDDSGLPDVAWRTAGGRMLAGGDWQDGENRTLVADLYTAATATDAADRALVVLHAGQAPAQVTLPAPRPGFEWRKLADSNAPDAAEGPAGDTLEVAKRSVVLLREAAAPGRRTGVDAEAVGRLARLAGIAPEWWDIAGHRHVVSDDTKRALLRGLRLPADTAADAAGSLARLSDDAARALPAALVVRAGERVRLRVGPDPHPGRHLLSITREDGGVERLTVSLEDAVSEPLVLPDGRVIVTRRLALPPQPIGRHVLRLEGSEAVCRLTVAPPRCYLPPDLRAGARVFGIAAQLYSLRRQDNDQGVGDFTALARLAAAAGRAGAAAIGLNPLHALFAGDRTRTSPYYPSDRRFLDPLSIDVGAPPLPVDDPKVRAAVAGAGFAALAAAKLVDTQAVWAAKRRVLEAAFAAFEALPPGAPASLDFAAFVAEGGPALRDFAAFEALAEAQGSTNWRAWPASLQQPGRAAVAATDPARQRFSCFLQWVADRQFAAAAATGRDAGLGIGFYRDLAVGAAPDGAEAWSAGDALMRGAWVGAPPDPFAPQGQVWGLPPPDPRALGADGYDGFAALLRANMRHAGALRIDHVMGLTRLFLVPEGASGQDGAYLAYPFPDLLGVAALESVRARCLIVGEDLGTVPPGIRETLGAADVLSYQVLRFARDDDGLRPPGRYPVNAAACAATHDLPTLAGWWAGADIAEAITLGLIDASGAMLAERARAAEKRELLALLRAEALPADPGWAEAPLGAELLAAIHALLARTPCRIVLVQADDLAGEMVGVNLPGTDKERPNWRRRLGIGVEALCGAQPAVIAALRAR